MNPNNQKTDVRCTVVFSAYVPVDGIDRVEDAIRSSNLPTRSLSVDRRQLDLSLGYAIVQAYTHIRPSKEELCAKIKETQNYFCDIQAQISERIDDSFFTGFAEHWLLPEGVDHRSCFHYQLGQGQKNAASMTATFSNGTTASVNFVSRPDHKASLAKSVTVIEVPEATEEQHALGLAFHLERGLESPLSITDLLSAKACWLEHNILVHSDRACTASTGSGGKMVATADATVPEHSEISYLETRLNQAFNATKELLANAFREQGDPKVSIELGRLISETTVLVAVSEMNVAMLKPVKSQLQQIVRPLESAGLCTQPSWSRGAPYPIWEALNGITYTESVSGKYKSLFEGLLACSTAGNVYNSSISLQNASRRERMLSQAFNWLTLVLAAAAFGVSTTAIVDNEIATAAIAYLFPSAGSPTMLAVFLMKLTSCAIASTLAAMAVMGIHKFMQPKVK